MMNSSEFFIIGGGISGLLSARELLLSGCQVTVLDQSATGTESSWAGGGILLPIYPWRQVDAISELVRHSLQKYPQLAQELLAATGIDPQWLRCGLLICKNPDIDSAINWCRRYRIHQEPASADQLRQFNSNFDQPLWLPDITQVRNPRLLKSLRAYLQQRGVRFIENSQIHHIEVNGQHISHLDTNQGRFAIDQLVLCTGAWTKRLLTQLLPQFPTQLAITPVRGQMLLFDAKPDTLKHMVLDGDHYLIPRCDGKILAGSTVEHTGFEKITTQAVYDQLYRFATGLLPALQNYSVVAHWAGLRPGTAQGVPYIGRHPKLDNLSINAGHFRNGLVMGPASARLLADLLLERPTELDPQPYSIQSVTH